jgi:hypothetical protein
MPQMNELSPIPEYSYLSDREFFTSATQIFQELMDIPELNMRGSELSPILKLMNADTHYLMRVTKILRFVTELDRRVTKFIENRNTIVFKEDESDTLHRETLEDLQRRRLFTIAYKNYTREVENFRIFIAQKYSDGSQTEETLSAVVQALNDPEQVTGEQLTHVQNSLKELFFPKYHFPQQEELSLLPEITLMCRDVLECLSLQPKEKVLKVKPTQSPWRN